ncbi:MAG: hypothetical protein LQ342_004805 [Letrouitia transgressa]|nr:MAG: hypothetical protein LQ342_004805 [Letrouitia transgressa]
MSTIINANNNNFIGVAIQYRLGAFGFLSSDEVQRYGAVNAGLLDQLFALQWVQSYIDLFGGNASQVSISGISAGGGAVMLQSMAFDGFLGDSLFENAIAVSPYLPQQYGYADLVPTQSYYAFASAAGCFTGLPPGSYNDSVFNCLVSKDTDTLQNASAQVSFSGRYGAWAFLPVTDGSFIQERPSQQLLKKKVNGRRMLSSNAANEGPLFTPQNIVTEDDFVSFLRDLFPLFTDDDISPVLLSYPSTNAPVSAGDPNFATSGIGPVTAVNQSTFGTGQQQRADNVYAETTFICPSYWLSEAFTGNGREAYKYQYSVIAAQHGVDSNAIFGPPNPEQGPDLVAAYMAIVGNFVTKNNPSISASLAIGSNGMGTTSNITAPGSVDPKPDQPNAATLWPTYSLANPYLLNLNQTGGTAFSALPVPTTLNITEFRDPGLRNDFTLENAYTWEGGRGARCDFWRSIGSIVPE